MDPQLGKLLFADCAHEWLQQLTPDHCHRRLVIEYLSEKWGNVIAVHL